MSDLKESLQNVLKRFENDFEFLNGSTRVADMIKAKVLKNCISDLNAILKDDSEEGQVGFTDLILDKISNEIDIEIPFTKIEDIFNDIPTNDILESLIVDSDLVEVVSCLDLIANEDGYHVDLWDDEKLIYPYDRD